MTGFWHDIRYGFRMLAKSPGFAAASILMLALGVGSATAIFSFVHSVLLRPLPYPDSERIVTLAELDDNGRRMDVSLPNYRDWAAQSTSFEAIAAYGGASSTVIAAEQSRRIWGVAFHGDFFSVMGSRVAHGRAFTAEEVASGAALAVVAHGFAETIWGEAEAALGERVEISGLGLTVIGVLARAFDERIDLYLPAAVFGPDDSTRTAHNWNVMARLRPGVSLAAARSEMRAIAQRLLEQHGRGNTTASVAVTSLLDEEVRSVRPALLALLAAGGLLLVIACANIANLLLARGTARQREIAVRQALGAGRARVIRQLILENAPLALLGGAAGIALAYLSFESLLASAPFSLPRRAEITMDAAAFGFGLTVTLGAGLLFAVAPAFRASQRRLGLSLRDGARTTAGGDSRLRRALVVAEFALALAVLGSAGLLTKSLVRLAQVDLGFDFGEILLAETELPESAYGSDAQVTAFWRRALERLEGLPQVEASGITSGAPLEGNRPNGNFEYPAEPGRKGYAWHRVADAGYFEALEIPLLQGRLFDEGDTPEAPHAAIINRTAAKKLWPGESPLGRRIRWIGIDSFAYADKPLTIVGVVGDVRHRGLTHEPDPEIFVNFFQRPARARDADVVVRTPQPAQLPEALRREFAALDATLPVRFQTLRTSYSQSLAQPRFQASLIGFFAFSALLLSAAGLFSAMAYAVSLRTREFGIRLALGATAGAVARQVLRDSVKTVLLGAVLGTALAIGAGRLIANQLYGVSALDVAVLAGAAALLAAAALSASYLPARRAARTDPLDALRHE